jgi:prepilin-type N-terminal cleavage/methylation domain-containing protein
MQAVALMKLTKRSSGFTLLEILVAMFLMAILLTVLVRVAGTTYRIGHEEIERGALEASALMASKRLEQDLLSSGSAGITLVSNGGVVAQLTDGVTASARVLFAPVFVYWRVDVLNGGAPAPALVPRLMRSELDSHPSMPFDGRPLRWSLADQSSLPLGVEGDRCTLSLPGISKLTLSNPAGIRGGLVGSPLTMEMEMQLPLASTRKTVRLVRTLQVRTNGA